MLLGKDGNCNMQIRKLAEAGHSARDVPGLRCHADVYRLILTL